VLRRTRGSADHAPPPRPWPGAPSSTAR
jgi:hypothetical protein